MSIALAGSVAGFFREAISQALESRRVDATEQATLYLVGLLSEFAHPGPDMDGTFERPMAFLLDEALRSHGAERFQRLRALGDGALYLRGFFADHIANRGIDPGYVGGVGSTAYSAASAMLRRRQARAAREEKPSESDVFTELAQNFEQFVDVLSEVAEGSLAQQAKGQRGMLALYERWLKSGSAAIASELVARGFVPQKGRGGLH